MSRKAIDSDRPAMIQTPEWKERPDPRDAPPGPSRSHREPMKFLVTHGAVGHHMQGDMITETDLTKGEGKNKVTADIDRLVNLGAIAPIPREDPMIEVRARYADLMTERNSNLDAEKPLSDVTARNEQ